MAEDYGQHRDQGRRERVKSGSARPRRPMRRASAGATLLAMLLGFFFAGLLDVGAIDREVRGRPLGAARSVQLALYICRALYPDRQ